MAPTDDAKALEAGTYRAEGNNTDEKAQFDFTESSRTENTSPHQETTSRATARMPFIRHVLLAVMLLAMAIVSIGSAVPQRPTTEDAVKFGKMLETVSEESLHAILKRCIPEKYQPGIWREGRTAMNAVHQEDASVATSLVELAKRQNVTVTSDVDTVTVPTTSTVVVPPPTTTSDDPDPTPTDDDQDPDPTPTPTDTVDPPVPTDDGDDDDDSVSPSTISPTTSAEPPTTITTTAEPTDGEPSQTTSQSPSETDSSSTNPPSSTQSTPTPGPTATSPTDSTTATSISTEASETETETVTPTTSTTSRTRTSSTTSDDNEPTTTMRSSTTQEVIFTTVRPDGTRSTITSQVVVEASEVPQIPAGPEQTPDLQDAAAGLEMAGVFGYAVIGLAGLAAAI